MQIQTHIRNRNLFQDLTDNYKIMKETDAVNQICIKYNLSVSYVENLIKEHRKIITKLRAKSCPVKIRK